jgi:GNAT superfamily N-acetyltransferase
MHVSTAAEPEGESGAELAQSCTAGDFLAIFQALDDFNAAVVGQAEFQPLAMPLRDAEGVVTGGLWGRTGYGWLMIQMMFVPLARRRQGLGASMVAKAEAEARRRGCIGMQVDTFSFQACGFYERLGFAVIGVQEDLPPGHRCYYLTKRLTSPEPARAGSEMRLKVVEFSK